MKKFIFFFTLILAFEALQGQIGINTPTPRGALDINRPTTNTMGLVLPTNTSAESVVNPLGGTVALGTTVYDSTKDCVRVYKSTGWSNCIGDNTGNSSSGGGVKRCSEIFTNAKSMGISSAYNSSSITAPSTIDKAGFILSSSGKLYALRGNVMDKNYPQNSYTSYAGAGGIEVAGATPVNAIQQSLPGKTWKEFEVILNTSAGNYPYSGANALLLSTDGDLYGFVLNKPDDSRYTYDPILGTGVMNKNGGTGSNYDVYQITSSTLKFSSFVTTEITNRIGFGFNPTDKLVYSWGATHSGDYNSTYQNVPTAYSLMRSTVTSLTDALTVKPADIINTILARNNTELLEPSHTAHTLIAGYAVYPTSYYCFIGKDGATYIYFSNGKNYKAVLPGGAKAISCAEANYNGDGNYQINILGSDGNIYKTSTLTNPTSNDQLATVSYFNSNVAANGLSIKQIAGIAGTSAATNSIIALTTAGKVYIIPGGTAAPVDYTTTYSVPLLSQIMLGNSQASYQFIGTSIATGNTIAFTSYTASNPQFTSTNAWGIEPILHAVNYNIGYGSYNSGTFLYTDTGQVIQTQGNTGFYRIPFILYSCTSPLGY